MISSLSHFDEGVFAVCNALLLTVGILLFAWWLSRRPPLPPKPKEPKYSERLQNKFRHHGSGVKKVPQVAAISDSSEAAARPSSARAKKPKRRKSK